MTGGADRMLGLGFSPCPNDTFMFWGLVSGAVPVRGVRFRPELADIESLNERAVAGTDLLEVTKLSVPAWARTADPYAIRETGAALGRGCGPLVVCRADQPLELTDLSGRTVAIPGHWTTARMLLTLFASKFAAEAMTFDQVMPAVAEGRVDAGLIIHESRFTYPDHGLVAVADLGELWEQATGLPLPLGLICVHRDLDPALAHAVEDGIGESVRHAHRHPEASRPFVREFAQEMDAAVCARHIELYVNSFSAGLGAEGRSAVRELLARGHSAGHLPPPPTQPFLTS